MSVAPRCSAVHVPVTVPEATPRWCVALTSTPTAYRPGPACTLAAVEASVSARTQCAPPCRIPPGCVFGSTGIVATARPGVSSVNRMPIARARPPIP